MLSFGYSLIYSFQRREEEGKENDAPNNEMVNGERESKVRLDKCQCRFREILLDGLEFQSGKMLDKSLV